MNELIIPIFMLIGIVLTYVIAVSKMTETEENKLHSKMARVRDFILFWFIIVVSIFQIASEQLSTDPVSRLTIFNIALYMSSIVLVTVLKLFNIFQKDSLSYERALRKVIDDLDSSHKDHLGITKSLVEKVYKE